jgi:hypothetical protein
MMLYIIYMVIFSYMKGNYSRHRRLTAMTGAHRLKMVKAFLFPNKRTVYQNHCCIAVMNLETRM